MSVDFANPSLFPLLSLAAAPLLIHLLFRRRTRRIEFPTLRLLRTVDPHLARRRRVHEWLLLALRTLAIALVALAVTRPYAGGGGGATTSDSVVVLDDSASMAAGGDASAWSRAVATARGVFDRMGAGDRGALHLLVAGPAAPAQGLTQDGRALVRALEQSVRTDARGSLASALARAGEALAKGTSPDRRVVLVTDLDAGAFASEDLAAAQRAWPAGTRLLLVPTRVPAVARDAALSRLAPGEGVAVVGRALHVTVGVERLAGGAADVQVELVAGGDAPRRARVAFSPAGTGEATFELVPASEGLLALSASVAQDDFAPDDRRHLLLMVRPRLDVVLLDADLDDPAAPALGGGALVTLALDPRGDSAIAGLRVTRLRPSDADPAAIRAADVLVVHDAPDLPAAVAAAVRARHREGAGLFVVAAARCAARGRAVPEPLEDEVPGRIATTSGAGAPAAALTVAAPDDPSLVGLRAAGHAHLEGANVRGVLEVATRDDSTVLLDVAGKPVLVRGPGVPAPAMLFAASLAPAVSPWTLRPTFLAFLHGLFPTLARGGVERPSVVAGAAGAPRTVLRAGVYDASGKDAATASFVAQPDLREAEGARLGVDAALARLGGDAIAVEADELEAASSRGAPRDRTGVLLALGAAALLAETVLAHRARRRLAGSVRATLLESGAAA